jgi:hypothetical protein
MKSNLCSVCPTLQCLFCMFNNPWQVAEMKSGRHGLELYSEKKVHLRVCHSMFSPLLRISNPRRWQR